MFERRLRIFLVFLTTITAVVIARAMQVQLIQHSYWLKEASKTVKHYSLTETTRGRLLDCKGRVLAEDVSSVDASVDYHAIVEQPDDKWVHDIALARIKARSDKGYRITRAELAQEIQQVGADINEMWRLLSREGDMSDDEMNGLRSSIVQHVQLSRRHAWYYKQKRMGTLVFVGGNSNAPPSEDAVRDWLDGDSEQCPFDGFDIRVAEEEQTHVILPAINTETANRLGKLTERMPFLAVTPQLERHYPFKSAACHVIGQLQPVDAKDVRDDPDEHEALRAYRNNDLIGRGGLEELCEPLLRGTRGRVQSETDSNGVNTAQIEEATAGKDVSSTIDMDLQQQLGKDVHAHERQAAR